jgi:hypothetical protein
MKKLLCGLAVAVLTFASCVGTSTGYSRDNVRPAIQIVTARHDAYVEADATLTPDQVIAYEHESFKAAALLAYDTIPVEAFAAAMPPVLDRVDTYIRNDASLTAPQQAQRLRTSQLLRDLMAPPGN